MSKRSRNRETKAGAPQSRFGWLMAAVVLMQVAGIFLPRHLFWGISFWQEVGRGLAFAVPAMALVLILSPAGKLVAEWLAAAGRGLGGVLGKLPRLIPIALGSLLLLALFFWFRSRALVYGDGFMVIDSFTLLDVKPQLATYFMKPLVLFWHRFWFATVSSLTSLTPTEVVSLVTAAGGVVGTWAIWRIAGLLSDSRRARYLIFAGACTSAAVILFFGYVENYTWATALGLWSLAFSLRYLEDGKRKGVAIGFGLLATGFHLFASPFLLIAIVAALTKPRAERLVLFGWPFKRLAVALMLFSFVAAVVMQLSGAFDFALNVWPTGDVPYAAISPRHLLDIANELWLVAPLGFLAMLLLLGAGHKEEPAPKREQALGLVALLSFLLAFWINPSLGAARDWDLLSFYGIPLSLWAVVRLRRTQLNSAVKPQHVFAATLVALVSLLPNLYEKNDLSRATARLDAILYEDPHYQTDYKKAERCLPWGYTLASNVEDRNRAEKYFRRRLSAVPQDPTGLFNIGSIFMRRDQLDSAAFYLRQAVARDSTNANSMGLLIRAEASVGTAADIRRYASRVARLFPDAMPMMTELGIAFQRHGLNAEALEQFRMANAHRESDCNEAVNLALMLAYLNQHDSACYYISNVLSHPCEDRIAANGLRQLISSSLKLGRLTDAQQALTRLSQLQPTAEDLPELRRKVQEAASRTPTN